MKKRHPGKQHSDHYNGYNDMDRVSRHGTLLRLKWEADLEKSPALFYA
jgi:hypothetical protein